MSTQRTDKIVIVIPAYNPDDKFITFLKTIQAEGYHEIIVVDDGCKPETQHYLDEAASEYNCQIVRHYVNQGQGRAFKSAFYYF